MPHATKCVQLELSEEEAQILPVFQIGKPSSNHAIRLEIMVNNKTLYMELDTGAAVSIISDEAHRKLFGDIPLQRSQVALKTCTG